MLHAKHHTGNPHGQMALRAHAHALSNREPQEHLQVAKDTQRLLCVGDSIHKACMVVHDSVVHNALHSDDPSPPRSRSPLEPSGTESTNSDV